MSRDLAINITSAALLLAGLVTIVVSITFSAAWGELLTTTAQALLLLAASWLLYKRQKLTILILAISTAHYLASGLFVAHEHNISLFTLISAFWGSLALRVLLVGFVFYLLKNPCPNSPC